MTQGNLSMKQNQTHRHKQSCSCKGRGLVEGWSRTLGFAHVSYCIYRMGKQQGPTVYSTMNYIQYPISPSRKEYMTEKTTGLRVIRSWIVCKQ